MANPATEKLAKILKLEAQTGYTDKAVTRGLQSFAAAWLADAAKNDVDAEWAESIAQDMRDYSAATELASRQSKLNALFEKLGKEVKSQNSEGRSQTNDVRRETTERRTTTYVEEREKPRLVVSSGQTSSLTQPTLQKSQSSNLSSAPRGSAAGLGLDAPVTKISGVGDANALKFNKLGVKTIRDLLYYFPVRYEDYSAMKTIDQLYFGEQVTLVGRIASARRQKTKNNLMIVKAVVEDESGMIECSWFTSERFVDSLMKRLEVGREVVVSGKVTEYLGRLSFQNPTLEPAEKDWLTGGSIVPVYSLTEGLQQLFVRRLMKRVSEYWSQRAPDFLPQSVRRETRMMALGDALREIHFPRDTRSQEQARRRLAFDELFVLQMAVLKQRQLWRGEPAPEIRAGEPTLDRCIASLPYQLTGAQRRAVQAVYNDIRKPMAMHRLLQGDVGSGKTVVAALGMALSASVGSQSALMAPTEILSEQHYKNLQTLFEAMNAKGALPKPIQIALLTGSVKASEKRAIYDRLASGEIHVVVGTHALIQEGVSFDNLGFVVIDEQHRFGVEQRTALRQKGALSPHTLVMTATPIPRTLALTLYGDLDNTVLDEMPPGRQPIETHWVTPAERERAYGFVRSQIETGRQAFVICPLVQESEKIEAKAAVEEYERLKSVFPKFTLGLLHGKMKAADKDEAMSAFARGETNLLVSTSVVEVGIDVPNATVMMIEGANRFGLSQLHQFRGRVGRGQHKSYCLLVADSTSDVSDQRLQAIVSSQDGFRLAEIDLEIRGPGEFFGTRQSGEPELKLVGIRDRDLLTLARNQAEKVIEADPTITSPENKLLSERVEAFWLRRAAGDAS